MNAKADAIIADILNDLTYANTTVTSPCIIYPWASAPKKDSASQQPATKKKKPFRTIQIGPDIIVPSDTVPGEIVVTNTANNNQTMTMPIPPALQKWYNKQKKIADTIQHIEKDVTSWTTADKDGKRHLDTKRLNEDFLSKLDRLSQKMAHKSVAAAVAAELTKEHLDMNSATTHAIAKAYCDQTLNNPEYMKGVQKQIVDNINDTFNKATKATNDLDNYFNNWLNDKDTSFNNSINRVDSTINRTTKVIQKFSLSDKISIVDSLDKKIEHSNIMGWTHFLLNGTPEDKIVSDSLHGALSKIFGKTETRINSTKFHEQFKREQASLLKQIAYFDQRLQTLKKVEIQFKKDVKTLAMKELNYVKAYAQRIIDTIKDAVIAEVGKLLGGAIQNAANSIVKGIHF